jgi:hypothetical protein
MIVESETGRILGIVQSDSIGYYFLDLLPDKAAGANHARPIQHYITVSQAMAAALQEMDHEG